MNAIIALCHFCDHHGPTTLFCTQAFKYSDYQSKLNSNLLDTDNFEIELDSAPPNSLSPNFSELSKTQISSNSVQFSSSPTESLASSQNCKACRAFEKNIHHYISYDNSSENSSSSSQICYMSQSNPNDSEVFALVRKACLRTLHCEVFEDPIYFDDDQNGSVIGYEFNIKDREGRGFQRSYSLIIIMKDRIYLQHLWSFLSQQMSIIASNIKLEAEKKFNLDMNEKGISINHSNGSSVSLLSSYKKNSKQVRGLIELTGDSMIFAKLHMWFTWILRTSACQISEDFMHGPLSEDLQVKLEREKLKEFSNSQEDDENDLDSLNLKKMNNLSLDFSISQTNMSSNLLIIKNDLNKIDHEYLLNNLHIESLKDLLNLIGYDKFHQLAYHTVIGNQVIIRGKYEKLISSIIKLLEELIPLGCCKTVYFSNHYLKSYECKLLGLSDSSSHLIDDLDNSIFFDDLNEYILLDIKIDFKNFKKFDSNSEFSGLENLTFKTINNLIDFKSSFSLSTNLKQIEACPSVLSKVESYLLNENLDDKSVSSLIKLAKEEWLNKTKVFYKFIQSPNVKSSISTDTVLQILKLSKNDELALKYWLAGLSNECKQQIRTS